MKIYSRLGELMAERLAESNRQNLWGKLTYCDSFGGCSVLKQRGEKVATATGSILGTYSRIDN